MWGPGPLLNINTPILEREILDRQWTSNSFYNILLCVINFPFFLLSPDLINQSEMSQSCISSWYLGENWEKLLSKVYQQYWNSLTQRNGRKYFVLKRGNCHGATPSWSQLCNNPEHFDDQREWELLGLPAWLHLPDSVVRRNSSPSNKKCWDLTDLTWSQPRQVGQ